MNDPRHQIPDGKTLVLYDGECGLCSRTVRFLLERDIGENLVFASNGSPLGKSLWEYLRVPCPPNSTLVVIDHQKTFWKSDAALQLARFLHWPYPWLRGLRVVPHRFRDWVYDRIAERRHSLAPKETCALATPAQRVRFLD